MRHLYSRGKKKRKRKGQDEESGYCRIPFRTAAASALRGWPLTCGQVGGLPRRPAGSYPLQDTLPLGVPLPRLRTAAAGGTVPSAVPSLCGEEGAPQAPRSGPHPVVPRCRPPRRRPPRHRANTFTASTLPCRRPVGHPVPSVRHRLRRRAMARGAVPVLRCGPLGHLGGEERPEKVDTGDRRRADGRAGRLTYRWADTVSAGRYGVPTAAIHGIRRPIRCMGAVDTG